LSWKKIPWSDEVAILTDDTPEPVDGTAEAVGTSDEAARADHIHALGPLVANLDFNKKEALKLVIEQLASEPADPTQGQIYYNTTDDHLYVYVVT